MLTAKGREAEQKKGLAPRGRRLHAQALLDPRTGRQGQGPAGRPGLTPRPDPRPAMSDTDHPSPGDAPPGRTAMDQPADRTRPRCAPWPTARPWWSRRRRRLRETLYRISQGQEDAAVIADEASGLPLGLITLREMLHVISFEGGDLDDPVAVHMIGAPLTLSRRRPQPTGQGDDGQEGRQAPAADGGRRAPVRPGGSGRPAGAARPAGPRP